MRVTLVALLVAGAFAAGWWVRGVEDARKSPLAATAAAPSATEVKDCRDACEQRAIVEKQDDDWLRSCRERCGPTGAGARRPYDPVRRVTRAPADHSPQ